MTARRRACPRRAAAAQEAVRRARARHPANPNPPSAPPLYSPFSNPPNSAPLRPRFRRNPITLAEIHHELLFAVAYPQCVITDVNPLALAPARTRPRPGGRADAGGGARRLRDRRLSEGSSGRKAGALVAAADARPGRRADGMGYPRRAVDGSGRRSAAHPASDGRAPPGGVRRRRIASGGIKFGDDGIRRRRFGRTAPALDPCLHPGLLRRAVLRPPRYGPACRWRSK